MRELTTLILFSLVNLISSTPVYSEWLASSAIARGQGNGLNSTGAPVDSYEHGTFQRALTHLYEKTGNKTYLNYIQTGLDNLITPNGTIQNYNLSEYTLDNLRIGQSVLQL
jgi:rhamnogalacturonyl hydrolase YesR